MDQLPPKTVDTVGDTVVPAHALSYSTATPSRHTSGTISLILACLFLATACGPGLLALTSQPSHQPASANARDRVEHFAAALILGAIFGVAAIVAGIIGHDDPTSRRLASIAMLVSGYTPAMGATLLLAIDFFSCHDTPYECKVLLRLILVNISIALPFSFYFWIRPGRANSH